MKRLLIMGFILSGVFCDVFAQGYNSDKTDLGYFVERMYKTAPFEGVKVITDYDHTYLLSVVLLTVSNYKTEQEMNRVAVVKAMSQASRFFNGSHINSDLIICTTEKNDGSTDTELIEHIMENSAGYVKALELLTNFDDSQGKRVFVYITEVVKQ